MKTLFPIHRIVAVTATTLLFLTGICVHATIYNWTNSAGGNWNNFTNWSPNQVPGAGDTAIITNAGTYRVNLNISPTVAVLILGASSGGTSQSLFTGSQTLTVNGLIQINAQGQFTVNGGTLGGSNMIVGMLTWSGGSLAGTMTLANSSVLNIVAGGGDGFSGLTLTNYGTVNWTNTTLYGINDTNAQIYNYGLWNAQSDNSFAGGFNGGTTLFDNFGTFLKSGSTNATILDGSVVFNNTGNVSVQSGTLGLHGGGTSSNGDFITAGAGNINIYGYTFTNGATFTGSGSYVAGGLVAFSGPILGTLNWDGGSLAGTTTLTTNSVLNIVAGGGDGFSGLTLTNYGTVNWTNTQLYGINDTNAQIYNYGLWNAQSDNSFAGGFNGGTTLFDNFGTFLKSGSTNATILDANVVFNNPGTVNVQSGTVGLHGGGTSSGGDFITAGGANINIYGYLFTNSVTFTGSGSYVAGGQANFAGTIVGTLTWSGGNVAGIMTLPTNSVLNIVAGGGDGLNGLTLTNYGTVNWTNTQLYGINDTNAQIYNYGLWNAQSDNSFAGGFNGGTTLFDNFGTFLKSGNTGSSTLDANVVFNNPGTVSVQNGTLGIQGSYSLANGTLNFGINSLTSYGAVSFPGSAALTGTLSANFNNGYMPATGSQFQVVSSTGRSGTFSSVNVPAGVSALYFNNSVVLDVTGLVPVEIINTHLAGSNLLFQFNTVSGQSYTIQWNDDVATNNWAIYTNFIGSGAVFQFQTPVMASPPQKFFRVLQP